MTTRTLDSERLVLGLSEVLFCLPSSLSLPCRLCLWILRLKANPTLGAGRRGKLSRNKYVRVRWWHYLGIPGLENGEDCKLQWARGPPPHTPPPLLSGPFWSLQKKVLCTERSGWEDEDVTRVLGWGWGGPFSKLLFGTRVVSP